MASILDEFHDLFERETYRKNETFDETRRSGCACSTVPIFSSLSTSQRFGTDTATAN